MKRIYKQALLVSVLAMALLAPTASHAQTQNEQNVSASSTSVVATSTHATSTLNAATSTAFVVASSTPEDASAVWYVETLSQRIQDAATTTVKDEEARTELQEQLDAIHELLTTSAVVRADGEKTSFGFWYSFRASFLEHLAVSRIDRFIGKVAIYQEREELEESAAQAFIVWAQQTVDAIRAQ